MPIVLSDHDREQLLQWVSASTADPRLVRRSRIVLQLSSGVSVHRAAQMLGISQPTIRLWRDRFLAKGTEGLTSDAPRPGRPRHARDQARSVVAERLKTVMPGSSLSIRALARETGLGRHLVHDVLNDMGVLRPTVRQLHRIDVAASEANEVSKEHLRAS